MITTPHLRQPRRVGGQALVEFAFAVPLFVLFLFTTIQLSLLFITYYSETQMAYQTARWLAINSTSSDLQVAQQVQATMLPGLTGGTPIWCDPSAPAAGCSFTPDVSTPDTVYRVGQMTVQFTPCITKVVPPSGPPCTNANRASSTTLHLQMSYNVAGLLFLPTTFRIGSLTTSLPTALPVYRVYLMVE